MNLRCGSPGFGIEKAKGLEGTILGLRALRSGLLSHLDDFGTLRCLLGAL